MISTRSLVRCCVETNTRAARRHFFATSSLATSATRTTQNWSNSLSFASPESDFVQSNETGRRQKSTLVAPEWTGRLSYASPESDFVQYYEQPQQHVNMYSTYTKEQVDLLASMPTWSGGYSFASPESDFTSNAPPPRNEELTSMLPRTYAEALQMEDAAIVVTTPSDPHYIVHVNHAWEGLCGFDQCEALYKKLDIIQGPESNTKLAQSVVNKVLETGKPHDAYLINYSKGGRRFTNHVAMGPLYLNEDEKDVEFLIGILEEVEPSEVPLRMVTAA